MKTHDLKIYPEYFAAVLDGRKTFEIRKNDRDYQAGDLVTLREWDPNLLDRMGDSFGENAYTGRQVVRRVTYITGYGQPEGQIVFAHVGVDET
jgi:hypothetical protein